MRTYWRQYDNPGLLSRAGARPCSGAGARRRAAATTALAPLHHCLVRRGARYVSLCGEVDVGSLGSQCCLRPGRARRCRVCDQAEALMLGKSARRGSGTGRPYRWHAAPERPCACGLTYARLRIGLTYHDVWAMLSDCCDDDPSCWRYKRRGTVLGLWHHLKLQYWKEHVALCTIEAPRRAARAARTTRRMRARTRAAARSRTPRRLRHVELRPFVLAFLAAALPSTPLPALRTRAPEPAAPADECGSACDCPF